MISSNYKNIVKVTVQHLFVRLVNVDAFSKHGWPMKRFRPLNLSRSTLHVYITTDDHIDDAWMRSICIKLWARTPLCVCVCVCDRICIWWRSHVASVLVCDTTHCWFCVFTLVDHAIMLDSCEIFQWIVAKIWITQYRVFMFSTSRH